LLRASRLSLLTATVAFLDKAADQIGQYKHQQSRRQGQRKTSEALEQRSLST